MILVSSCLIGLNCKYNGGNNLCQQLVELVAQGRAIPVCPEQMGGSSTPRPACEIVGGSGEDVLIGKAKVINQAGEDVTETFIRSGREVLALAKIMGVKTAILKERSPSCGSCHIYTGDFDSTIKAGQGVTTAILRQNGITVLSEDNYRDSIKL